VENASRGQVGNVDLPQVAHVAQVEGPHDVTPHSLFLVVLAPVHVWPSGHAGAVEHVGGLVAVELFGKCLPVFHPDLRHVDHLSLVSEEFRDHPADPASVAH